MSDRVKGEVWDRISSNLELPGTKFWGIVQAMESIAFSHNFFLVTMSCIVALLAGFTGLSLTRNLSNKSVPEKAISVALAAVALMAFRTGEVLADVMGALVSGMCVRL